MKKLFTFLRSRFVIIPLAIAIPVGAWNIYITQHADGVVYGQVLTADGLPVAGVTITMMEKNFTTNSERGKVVSATDGHFIFTNNRSHNIQLRASKQGYSESEQKVVRLNFKSQNVTLKEPLVITPNQDKP